jgi:hypothetical protein
LTGIKSNQQKTALSGVGHQSCAQQGEQLSVAQKAAIPPKVAKRSVKITEGKGCASVFLKIFYGPFRLLTLLTPGVTIPQ